MAKALPYGMMANMMAIVGVEALARKSGGHYGEYEANNDTSAFRGASREVKYSTCMYCGEKIEPVGYRNRRVCDKCSAKNKRDYARERARAAKEKPAPEKKDKIEHNVEIDADGTRWVFSPCRICGEQTKKRKAAINAICCKCKREKKNAQRRLRRERRNALSEV